MDNGDLQMKLIFENWKRFVNESKEIFKAEKLEKKARGKTVYRVKHMPSGATIPVEFYEGSVNNVKALAKFLNGEKFDGVDSKKLSDKTLKSIHDAIIDSKYKNPNFTYTKTEESEE